MYLYFLYLIWNKTLIEYLKYVKILFVLFPTSKLNFSFPYEPFLMQQIDVSRNKLKQHICKENNVSSLCFSWGIMHFCKKTNKENKL